MAAEALVSNLTSNAIFEVGKLAFFGAASLLSAVEGKASPQTARFASLTYYKLLLFLRDSGIQEGELRNGYEVCPGQVKWLLEQIKALCNDVNRIRECYDVTTEKLTAGEVLGQVQANSKMRGLAAQKSWIKDVWRNSKEGVANRILMARFDITKDSEKLTDLLFRLDMFVTQLSVINPELSEFAMKEGWRVETLNAQQSEDLKRLNTEVEEAFRPIVEQMRIQKMNPLSDGQLLDPKTIDGDEIPETYMQLLEDDRRTIVQDAELMAKKRHWISSIKAMPVTKIDKHSSPGTPTDAYEPNPQNTYMRVIVERKVATKGVGPDYNSMMFPILLSWKRMALLCYSQNKDSKKYPGAIMLDVVGRTKDPSLHEHTMYLVYRIPRLENREEEVVFETFHDIMRNKTIRVPLEDRIALARSLLHFVYRYHQVGWMHKHICGNNILLFRYQSERPGKKLRPFVVGFDYARRISQKAANDESEKFKYGATDDDRFYRHPFYTDETGFEAKFDLFSIGVLLWEIGTWESGFGAKLEGWKAKSASSRQEIQLEASQKLQFAAGRSYTKVVEACLWGDFENPRTKQRFRVSQDYAEFELQLVAEMEKICSGLRIKRDLF